MATLAGAGLVTGGVVLGRGRQMNFTARELTLRAAVGEALSAVASRSDAKLDLTRLSDEGMTIVQGPLRFVYEGALGFPVSATRLVTMNSTAAVITSLELAAHVAADRSRQLHPPRYGQAAP